ncbi:MAG: nickel-dependent hydrogenase large subunit [Acidobacteria bacterium]|nr:nickel-dependent hydrogenase large subunit [Acidobacteriota bacterium]
MTFRSLPIEFDVYGRAHLRDEDAVAPFSVNGDPRIQRALNRERALEKLADNKHVWSFNVSPVTRVAGNMSLHAVVDFEQRRVLDAQIENAQFCGYEMIAKGREPSDAVHIASRARGTSSVAHTVSAAMALEMACGVTPPPLAIIARNLGSCGEVIGESAHHLFVLAGPDYSEAAISRTSLPLWGKAQKTPAPGVEVHGMDTIAEVMRGLNPLSGHLYLESLQMMRLAREIVTVMLGKYPHPSGVVPGGIGVEANKESLNQVLGRVNTLLDYAKKVVAIWDDLVDFFYDAEPRYRRVGELPGNLLSVGLWDDPESYDASYINCNSWSERRMAVPGVMVNGELRTSRLSDINIGIEEFVDHSFYQNWSEQSFQTDPMSGPLSPNHPWNKQTVPAPVERDWRKQYSWAAAPRWDREPMETGALARMWINTVSANQNCEFITTSRRLMEIALPKGQLPPITVRWLIPERPNTLERIRARAYQVAYAGMVAYANLLQGFDYIRRGEVNLSQRFRVPEKTTIGVGFWECGRGAITHHLAIAERRLMNYQIITPTEWMGSPRDAVGVPGIYEAAIMNTPLLEECARSEDLTGVDILRTVRSFDP